MLKENLSPKEYPEAFPPAQQSAIRRQVQSFQYFARKFFAFKTIRGLFSMRYQTR